MERNAPESIETPKESGVRGFYFLLALTLMLAAYCLFTAGCVRIETSPRYASPGTNDRSANVDPITEVVLPKK